MQIAVVILSGGMDSTTLLYKVKKDYKKVYAISFNYNQKHKKELQSLIQLSLLSPLLSP